MCQAIKILDPLLSSQIAAGEVVERPASVVKELMENSIDAGADRISIEIVNGGTKLIRVSDNGVGMSREDAELSLKRFATSKISSFQDLEKVKTLGFRGEALPSIASCSKLTLETKVSESDIGICLRVVGGELTESVEKGLPSGTIVTVKELFFNTPARLKFMKSVATERNAVIDIVEKFAIAWPNISFTLTSQNRLVFHTSGSDLRNALINIFGPEIVQTSVEVTGKQDDIQISGFVGLPRIYRRSRDRQLFFVNQRPVKNVCLGWALDRAFSGFLPPKSYPVAFLEITVNPSDVDVNVHPTKAEIKFKNENTVRRIVTHSVKNALRHAGYMSTSESTRDTWVDSIKKSRSLNSFVLDKPDFLDSIVNDAQRQDVETLVDDVGSFEWQYMGSLEDTYLVVKTPESLLIIDQHALAEALAYQSLCQGQSASQELLLPEIVKLEPKEAVFYEDHKNGINRVGFSVRSIGTRTVLVSRVPLILGNALPADSLKQVLALAYGTSRTSISPERSVAQARLATAACHASIKGKQALGRQEAVALIKSLKENPTARVCPHGRPTIFVLPYSEIERYFGR